MVIKEEFTQTLDWLKPAIDAIIITARDLQESKSLHEILYMVLLAGNYLNAVSSSMAYCCTELLPLKVLEIIVNFTN